MAREGNTQVSKVQTIWIDAEGFRIDDPHLAVSGEIIETFDDGSEERTHWTRHRFDDDPPYVMEDANVGMWQGGDTLKMSTWDLRLPTTQALVQTLPDLLLALGIEGAPVANQKTRVRSLVAMPVWRAAPEGLKAKVRLWLHP